MHLALVTLLGYSHEFYPFLRQTSQHGAYFSEGQLQLIKCDGGDDRDARLPAYPASSPQSALPANAVRNPNHAIDPHAATASRPTQAYQEEKSSVNGTSSR